MTKAHEIAHETIVRAPDHEAAADTGWAQAEAIGLRPLSVTVVTACPPTLWRVRVVAERADELRAAA